MITKHRISSALSAVCATGLALGSTGAAAALGDTATFTFNLPSTAVASQTPPYPTVATLTLTEVAGGVDFLLTPNWGGTGTGFSDASFIERLDIVYKGAAPTFTNLGGTPAASWSYETNPNNMDSGYKTADQHLILNWASGKTANRLDAPETSSWEFSGTLADFTGTEATSGPKPSPIFGVISVTSYSLTGVKPTPSNWVAAIPEPETYALVLAGLGLVGWAARRRAQR